MTDLLETIPIQSTSSKADLENWIREFIRTNLEYVDSGTLYIHLKEIEYAIKQGIENLKEQAFTSLGEQLGGLNSGRLLGHQVSISYPNEWHYSPAVDKLKENQKKTLTELQEREKREKIAKQIQGQGRITVTIRDA
jgi:hypothetical protein